MLPIKSNISENGCSPVSSNCVIWQGPCLPCLNINPGDTVSDVVYTLATEICGLTGNLGLSTIDFSCLVDSSLNSPVPEKTLANFITLLINKVCTLQDIIDNLPDPSGSTIPSVQVATCFQTLDDNGDPILNLPITDYIKAIANKVCALATTVTNHTTELDNHETRITTLENLDHTIVLPTVNPTCIYGSDTSSKTIVSFVQTLEQQFCTLIGATGNSGALLTAVGKQCVNLNSSPALGSSGNMSAIDGWKSTVSTVADSINNLWLTMCDIRTAVAAVQQCCSKTCADITVNFAANVADNGNSIKLYFPGYTFIPSGFTNCTSAGSKLTITDGLGGSYVSYIDLITASSGVDPVTISLSSTPLNPTGTYSLSLDSCVTNGDLTCSKTVMQNVTGTPLSCNPPTNVTVTLS